MRCFVAVELEESLKRQISIFQSSFDYVSMKRVEKENLHMTLKFLGEVEEKKIGEIKRALEDVSRKFEPFGIEFCGIGVFPNPSAARVLWIGIEGERMTDLCKEVDAHFSHLGFPEEKNIVPHLTIGRIRHVADRKRLREGLERYSHHRFGEMKVDSIKIKKSTLTLRGPVYSDVEEIRL